MKNHKIIPKFEKSSTMKNIWLIALIFLFASCGAQKEATDSNANQSENKIVLPPDTGSNKYAKKRK